MKKRKNSLLDGLNSFLSSIGDMLSFNQGSIKKPNIKDYTGSEYSGLELDRQNLLKDQEAIASDFKKVMK